MQQLWIVWFAILSSPVLCAVVLWQARPADTSPAPDATVVMIGGLAAVVAAISVAWGRIIPAPEGQTRHLVRWALAEAVSILGLVLGFVGGPLLVSGCLMAIGFVLIAAQPPATPLR